MTAASTWQRDAWEAFARWCEHGPYTDDREAPHAEAFVAGYEAGSATVELGPDRRDRGARFAPGASASSASDKTPNTGSSGPSSAATTEREEALRLSYIAESDLIEEYKLLRKTWERNPQLSAFAWGVKAIRALRKVVDPDA